ncbi:MAG: LacI family DNA-binding transcriptional regulator [Oscillospiraceae bacterium]|nr:LacI family DNA-binding transcriptional regulator [Oscillospiraceae bacterium]
MKKDVRMIDIANSLNISVVTVSNALNDREGVSSSLRSEIKKAAEDLGYKYTSNEKLSSRIMNRNIGILMSERFVGDKGTFYLRLCQVVSKELLKSNLFAITETLSKDDEKRHVLPKVISESKISGLIVLGQLNHDYLDVLVKCCIPVIFLDFYDKHYNIDCVVTDNFYGMYLLTDYLIECGHTSLGFVGNVQATSSIQDRYLGYIKAQMENNMDPSANERFCINDRDENGIFLKDIVLPPQLPTAFVCNCDETAFRVINKLRSKKINVPSDVSVVGFDNFLVSDVCDPPITTVEVNLKAMAGATVEIMLKKLEDSKYKAGRKIILGKIVMKESVQKII